MSITKVNHEDVRQAAVDLPSIATITTTDVDVTGLVGVKAGELYLVAFDLGAAGLDDGVGYSSTAWATDDGQLTVRFVNPTAGAIDPAAGVEMTYLQL
jgi:hypothetical protein